MSEHGLDEINGFKRIGDFTWKCSTCGKEVPAGIISLANHWAECAGKETMENIHKIDKMPLNVENKMNLLKQVFGIEQ